MEREAYRYQCGSTFKSVCLLTLYNRICDFLVIPRRIKQKKERKRERRREKGTENMSVSEKTKVRE